MGLTQNQDGSYNEKRLANGLKLAKMLRDGGLEPIIDLRVHIAPAIRNYTDGYTTWPSGLPQADWVVNDAEGKGRFIDCWKKLIEVYNPSIIDLWHFPGHNGGFAGARDLYMSNWGTDVVNELREVFKGEIIFTLPYQASSESRGSKSYWMIYYDPLPDVENVTYGVGHMSRWHISNYETAEWNYDMEELERDFEGIKRYVDMGERVAAVEFGAFNYFKGEKPLQSRLDYLDALAKKMKEFKATWCYHCIRPQGQKGGYTNVLEDVKAMKFQPDILSVLRNNIFSPSAVEPPVLAGCIIAFLLPSMGLSTLLPYLRLCRSHLPGLAVNTYYTLSNFIMGLIP